MHPDAKLYWIMRTTLRKDVSAFFMVWTYMPKKSLDFIEWGNVYIFKYDVHFWCLLLENNMFNLFVIKLFVIVKLKFTAILEQSIHPYRYQPQNKYYWTNASKFNYGRYIYCLLLRNTFCNDRICEWHL